MTADWAVTGSAIAAGLVAIAAIVVPIRRRLAPVWRKFRRSLEIITGEPEETDPFSGALLRPAVPDIGTRVSTVEMTLRDVVVASIARIDGRLDEQARQIADLNAKQGVCAERQARLEQQVDTWQRTDRVQADAMRAALTEVGLDTEIPAPRDTPKETPR